MALSLSIVHGVVVNLFLHASAGLPGDDGVHGVGLCKGQDLPQGHSLTSEAGLMFLRRTRALHSPRAAILVAFSKSLLVFSLTDLLVNSN